MRMSGVRCVMTSGAQWTPQWPADSWDSLEEVLQAHSIIIGNNRQYYFNTGVQARTEGFMNGATTQQIWLDNVACTGRENRLIDCPAAAFGVHDCNHGEDAGVRCPAARKALIAAINISMLGPAKWQTCLLWSLV